MIGIPCGLRIFIISTPTDMRKGYDSLAAIVRNLGYNPMSGHLFVFFSKRKNRYKFLYWQRDGFVIQMKRLARGTFRLPPAQEGQRQVQVDAAQLALLLEGIDFTRLKRTRRWKPTPLALKDPHLF